MKIIKPLCVLFLFFPLAVRAQGAKTPLTYNEYYNFVSHFDADAHSLQLPAFLKAMKEKNVVIFDLRPEDMYKESHIVGATYLGADVTEEKLKALVPSKDTKILLYCDYSLRPVRTIGLTNVVLPQIAYLGYENVYKLEPIWKDSGVINGEEERSKLPMTAGGTVAEAHKKNPGDALYYYCEQDSDCVIVEDACPNSWSAINRNYQEWHEQQVNEQRPLIECMPPDKTLVKPETVPCIDHACRAGWPAK